MTSPSLTKGASSGGLVGQIVDGYQVESVLGSGGMGVVYVVRHVELGSVAALKTLHRTAPEELSAESRTRFLTEARALSRVSDPGLVKMFNFGHLSDGSPYIIMELLEGQTLRMLLSGSAGGKLPVADALAIVEQAAGTLASLHRHGVIHRDIKPENIMLVPDRDVPGGQRVKLLDFGIAKLVEPTAPQLTQEPLGTPLYISPEVCRDEEVTPQADVYSLGCVLYEMLSGRPPYQSESNNGLMMKHMFNTPEPVRRYRRDASPAVQALVSQLLSKEPRIRPTMTDIGNISHRLRQHAGSLLRTRLYWKLLQVRSTPRGKLFAALLGMPILLLCLLALLAFSSETAARWLSPLVPRLTNLVQIPSGRFKMGSTDEEITIAQDMVADYSRKIPSEAARYQADYIDSPRKYFSREQPVDEVLVQGFEIERYEVTNEDFVKFLNIQIEQKLITLENQCPVAGKPNLSATNSTCVYLTSTHSLYKNLFDSPIYGGIRYMEQKFVVDPTARHRPVVAMSWQAANDYCHWRYGSRGRLPTEVEWEYVVRRDGRRFPWGNEQPWCSHAVVERCGENRHHCQCEPKDSQRPLPDAGTTQLDRSLDGVMDLAGSVSEWTSDWLHLKLPTGPDRLTIGQKEGNDPTERNLRVIRGGAWTLDFLTTRGAARFGSEPERASKDVGFRCVRGPA